VGAVAPAEAALITTTPLEALRSQLRRGAIGRLMLNERGVERCVHIAHGAVLAAVTSNDDLALVHRLANVGVITEQQTERFAEAIAEGVHDGSVLYGQVRDSQLMELHAARFEQNLLEFLGAEGEVRFEDTDGVFIDQAQFGHDTRALLAALAERRARVEEIRGELADGKLIRGDTRPRPTDDGRLLALCAEGASLARILGESPREEAVAIEELWELIGRGVLHIDAAEPQPVEIRPEDLEVLVPEAASSDAGSDEPALADSEQDASELTDSGPVAEPGAADADLAAQEPVEPELFESELPEPALSEPTLSESPLPEPELPEPELSEPLETFEPAAEAPVEMPTEVVEVGPMLEVERFFHRRRQQEHTSERSLPGVAPTDAPDADVLQEPSTDGPTVLAPARPQGLAEALLAPSDPDDQDTEESVSIKDEAPPPGALPEARPADEGYFHHRIEDGAIDVVDLRPEAIGADVFGGVVDAEPIEMASAEDVEFGDEERVVTVGFSAPPIGQAAIRSKLEVCRDVLSTVTACIDLYNGPGSGQACAQLLLDGAPNEYAILFQGLEADRLGNFDLDRVYQNLCRRPPAEHRRLIRLGLFDLIDRTLNCAKEELPDDAMEKLLRAIAGYQRRFADEFAPRA